MVGLRLTREIHDDLRLLLMDLAKKFNISEEDFLNKEKEIGSQVMIQAGRYVFLKTVDHFWQEHLEEMEHVRDSVRLRAYGQQDPLVEYKNEGHKLFRQLLELVEGNVVQNLMKLSANTDQAKPQPVLEKKLVLPAGAEVNRNDPCPCGSGKKYKKCHGA